MDHCAVDDEWYCIDLSDALTVVGNGHTYDMVFRAVEPRGTYMLVVVNVDEKYVSVACSDVSNGSLSETTVEIADGPKQKCTTFILAPGQKAAIKKMIDDPGFRGVAFRFRVD